MDAHVIVEKGPTVTVAPESIKDEEEFIRETARIGRLGEYPQTRFNGALYGIVSKLVYERLTRKVERARGHYSCAASIDQMHPECHDRHQDDVAAVREDLLRNASVPIANLEGWMVSRLNAVTIDAHRRRRGERGALQRPRRALPRWLVTALGADPWLNALAIEILTWVGVPTSAGAGIWPLDAWADRRSALTGESTCSESQIAKDVETVLAAMRTKTVWFEKFVERPLGHKHVPVYPAQRAETDTSWEPAPLALVEQYEIDDAHLLDLATKAFTRIESRVKCGEALRPVVIDVLSVVFTGGSDVEHIGRVPGETPDTDELVARMIARTATVDRIVNVVTEILSGR